MRLFSLGLAAALCAAGAASAADLAARKAAPAGLVDRDFAGSYAGLHLGGAWGGAQIDAPTLTGASVGIDAVAGGAHLGYNLQFGHVVVGFETEFDGSSANKKFVFGAMPGHYSQAWFGSVDARFGWVSGDAMVYAVGGYAWSAIEGRLVAGGGAVDVMNAARDGYVVGCGLDYAVTDRLNWRVEYRYYDFGRQNFNAPAAPAPGSARIAENVVRAGVSYRFSAF